MLLLVAGGVFFYVRRFRREASVQGRQNLISEAERWLEAKVPELEPWNSLSLTDVSDFMTFVYTKFITDKLHGEVKSLSQNRPIIAFYRIWHFATRYLLARTTAHRWHMVYRNKVIEISLNGERFGSWDLRSNMLLGADGSSIGEARRPTTIKINDIPATWGGQWYPVKLRGVSIGEIMAQRGANKPQVLFINKIAEVRPASPSLPPEEELWLLALTVIEMGYWQSEFRRVEA